MSGHVSEPGFANGGPRLILRLEGLAVFMAAIALYAYLTRVAGYVGAGWLAILFFLLPDLSLGFYALGSRLGAFGYNVGHTYVAPIAFMGFFLLVGHIGGAILTLLWVAHIGFDRALGFGLKYPTAFAQTHLGLIGGAKKSAAQSRAS